MNADIEELSRKVLNGKELEKVNETITRIENGDKSNALIELIRVLGTRPKRPLYYISHSISELPKYGTRDIIRYSGDYIDHLIRFTLEDKRFLSCWFMRPLGPNIEKLKKYIDTNLYDSLISFNRIYAQSKHVFNHHEDKSFFNFKDAISMIYITKEISKKILPLSARARDYNNDGATAYSYNEID